MIAQFATAIGTYKQSGKHIVLTVAQVPPAQIPAHFLYSFKCCPVSYRLVNIFEYHHIFRIIFESLFAFIRYGISFEVNDITAIFP